MQFRFAQKLLLLLPVFVLSVLPARAQVSDPPPPSFEQVVAAYERYWEGRVKEKGTGWKPFERWRWYWETRLMPDGSFPPADITQRAWEAYVRTHPTVAHKSANDVWSFSGPATTPGGYNGLGRLNCIAFHPTAPNTFWVGSPGGGLWKTTDGGGTWTTTTDQNPVLGVSDLVVHPTNPDTLYMATGDGERAGSLMSGSGNPAPGDTKSIGVLKSVDGGATWQPTGLSWTTNQFRLIRRLIMNPQNPQTLYAGTTDGIYRTYNGGASWVRVRTGMFADLAYSPGDTTVIYASTYGNSTGRIYRSTNGGGSWSLALTLNGVSRIEMAVTPQAPGRVDAIGCYDSSDGFAGYWRSHDQGASFTQILTGTCANNFMGSSATGNVCRGQGNYDMTLAIDPADSNNIWIGGVNNWNSTDGGQNWTLRSHWFASPVAPTVHADKHATVFHPLVPGRMFDCNDGGVYQTDDNGQSWTDRSNGLGISQIYRIGVSQTNPGEVIIGMQDNGSRGLFQNYWYERTGGDGMDCHIDYTDATIQYGSYVNGTLYRTTNRWNTRTTISNNIPGQPTGAWLTPMAIHPTRPATIYAGYRQVYRSDNRGNNWAAISPDLFPDYIRVLALAPSDSNRIYVSNYLGLVTTNNEGASWQTLPQIVSGQRISDIEVDPADAGRLYITMASYAAGNKVFLSTDSGLTWTNISGTLPNVPANCVAYEGNSIHGLYVGTDVGVFYKNDTMADWLPYQSGLPNVVVTDLEISNSDQRLYAGTYGRGLWQAPLFTTGPVSVKNTVLASDPIRLYPNPATDQLRVTAGSQPIERLVILDIHGRPLLDQKVAAARTGEATVQVQQLPVGSYVIQVWTTDGNHYPRRFTIQR